MSERHAFWLELERRFQRRKSAHARAWKWYQEFKDYHDPDVAAQYKRAAELAAARLDEIRLIQNALRRGA